MFNFLFLSALLASAAVATAEERNVTEPSEAELFGRLVNQTDTSDVLFICDFLKSHDYRCDVTVLGVEHLKNKSVQTDERKGAKIAVQNVTGKWQESDGLMKENYLTSSVTKMVAKCFFHLAYFECFGVSKCTDPPMALSPCYGGEPWRGQFEGAPNSGFKGQITAQAMMSPPMVDSSDQQPPFQEETTTTGRQTSGSATKQNDNRLSAPIISKTQDESGSTKITAFLSSPNKDSQVNITFWTSSNNDSNAFVAATNQKAASTQTGFGSLFPNLFPDNLFQPIQSLFGNGNAGFASLNPFSTGIRSPSRFDNRQSEDDDDDDEEIPTTTRRRRRPRPTPGAEGLSAELPPLFRGPPKLVENDDGNVTSSNKSSVSQSRTNPQLFGGRTFFNQIQSAINNFQNTLFSSFWSSFPQIKVDGPAVQMRQPAPLMASNPRFAGFKIVVQPIDAEEERRSASALPRWFEAK